MPIHIGACPLCQHSTNKRFTVTQFRGSRVEYHICNRCGFVFQNPRMTREEVEAFYSSSYRQIYQGGEGPTRKDLAIQKERAKNLLHIIKGVNISVYNHLDIGCSAGFLMDTFQNAFDCKSVGVEPGDAYRKYSQEQGFEVYSDLENLSNDSLQKFDLISIVHVLEHISDPVVFLEEIRMNHLGKGGYVLIEVPNLYCHDSFEIAHMSAFSKHTLMETLEQAGFNIVFLKVQGAPRSKILPLYLTFIGQSDNNKSDRRVKPENWVRQKRQFGMISRRIFQRLFPKSAWIKMF